MPLPLTITVTVTATATGNLSYLDGEGPAGDGKDRAVEEVGAELFGVESCRGDHQPEVLPPLQ